MRVRLATQISGTRDGVAWPRVGTVVDLPDDEAMSMLYAGTATALDDGDDVERGVTVPASIEKAQEKFIPETARHEPAVGEENLPDEDRRPNLDAVGLAEDGSIGHGPDEAPAVDDDTDMVEAAKSGPVTTATGPSRVVRKTTPKK